MPGPQRSRAARSRAACSALAGAISVLLLSASGCAPTPLPRATARPEPVSGPIVLITVEGLRADSVGAFGGPGWTSQLDALIGDASWAGRAVAPSSWLVPSLASVFTGLRPWQHQAITPFQSRLAPTLTTLAEALGGLGYEAHGFHDNSGLADAGGFEQGFRSLSGMRHGLRAIAALADCTGGKELFWLHLDLPLPPYVQRPWVAQRMTDLPPDLPRRLGWRDLEPFVDPDRPRPPRLAEQARLLYRFNVFGADLQLGRLLEGLRQSGHYDEATIAVVGLYGQELGDQGRMLFGESLGRAVVEVPLILKLPRGSTRRIAVPPGERVALARVWATLVEAAGGTAAPGVAPSLFAAEAVPLLSELYAVGGHNELSLVEADRQLRWISTFTDGDRAYYDARAAAALDPKGPAKQELRNLVRQLHRAFREVPPLAGKTPPRLLLERWLDRGTAPLDGGEQAHEMAVRLRDAWERFAGAERSAADLGRDLLEGSR